MISLTCETQETKQVNVRGKRREANQETDSWEGPGGSAV